MLQSLLLIWVFPRRESGLQELQHEQRDLREACRVHRAPLGFGYYHRRDLEHTFFQTGVHKICSKISAIFAEFSEILYSNLGITTVKITETLRNSENIGEHLTNNCKICRLLWKSTKIVSNFAKWCRSLEIFWSQKSGMVQRKKNVDLVKSFLKSIYLQNLASTQSRIRYPRQPASRELASQSSFNYPALGFNFHRKRQLAHEHVEKC